MGEQPGVQVRPSIMHSWRAIGGHEVWVQVRSAHLAFAELVAAIEGANGWALPQSSVMGTFPTVSARGHAFMLSGVVDSVELSAWLDAFSTELAGFGSAAVVSAAPAARVPDWVIQGPAVPTAFVAWSLDLAAMTADPERNGHWHVPSEARAARLTRLLC